MTTSEFHLQFRSQDDMGRHKYHKIKDDTYCKLVCCHVLPLRNHHASPNQIRLHSCDKPIVYLCLLLQSFEGFPILQLLAALTYLCGYILHTRHTWKKYYRQWELPQIRLTSYGQWSQLWELGIIWFCTSHKLHTFKRHLSLRFVLYTWWCFLSEFGWIKNSCKSNV